MKNGQWNPDGCYIICFEKCSNWLSKCCKWCFSLCPQQFEEPCKLMNKSGGSEIIKTGSQVLDSICISEAEKQAVLTLIREEVHTFTTVLQGDKCLQCLEWSWSFHDSQREMQLKADVRCFFLFRSSPKSWKSVTGRRGSMPADKKSLRWGSLKDFFICLFFNLEMVQNSTRYRGGCLSLHRVAAI